MIMEAAKSHNLPSASWRPRKASGIIQLKSEGLRPQGADGVTPSPRAGDEMRCPSSSSEAEKKGQIPPSSGLCSVQSCDGLEDAHPHWGGPSTLLGPPTLTITQGKELGFHRELVEFSFSWVDG